MRAQDVLAAAEAYRSVYRLYQQAMANHLRAGRDDTAVHATIAHALTDHVPLRGGGIRDWAHAHPHTLRYLATHAARGGVLDEVLSDPEYLVHADSDALTPYLHTAIAARSAWLRRSTLLPSIPTAPSRPTGAAGSSL
jgi:hypothetical protein